MWGGGRLALAGRAGPRVGAEGGWLERARRAACGAEGGWLWRAGPGRVWGGGRLALAGRAGPRVGAEGGPV